MKLDKYQLSSDKEKLVFSFLSIGSSRVITKIIVYEPIAINIYNLAFGDYNHLNNSISDSANSNNGDAKKVIATVVSSLFIFFEEYPSAEVLIEGSDDRRTKAYQRIIREYSHESKGILKILGKRNGGKSFEKLDFANNYIQFRISKI